MMLRPLLCGEAPSTDLLGRTQVYLYGLCDILRYEELDLFGEYPAGKNGINFVL